MLNQNDLIDHILNASCIYFSLVYLLSLSVQLIFFDFYQFWIFFAFFDIMIGSSHLLCHARKILLDVVKIRT
jgi:hypothetical protein